MQYKNIDIFYAEIPQRNVLIFNTDTDIGRYNVGSGKSKKSGSGFGIGKMDGREIPENPDPGKIPGPNLRDPERDSGFFKIF
jgi:hypothetical protein